MKSFSCNVSVFMNVRARSAKAAAEKAEQIIGEYLVAAAAPTDAVSVTCESGAVAETPEHLLWPPIEPQARKGAK